MEQQEPREEFVKNLHSFCEEVQLNDAFIDALKEHPYSKYIELVLNFCEPSQQIIKTLNLNQSAINALKEHQIDPSIEKIIKYKEDMAKKAFIFLEFTKERDTCNEMIKILKKCGQRNAANLLKQYNSSPPFIPFSYEKNLKVTPASVLKEGNSKILSLKGKPRGKCVIINNVTDSLSKESHRFANIFEQLFFDILLLENLTAAQIEAELKAISSGPRLESLVLISHGYNEKVICSDGKDLHISDIVDIFSEIEKNCSSLKRKPKLFFFNCCRIKEGEVPVTAVTAGPGSIQNNEITLTVTVKLQTVGQNWINNNKCTFICFACAEGHESWFIPNQFTYFGQALSHCIAQYACDNDLIFIMNRTSQRMKGMGSPEIRLCHMTRELYFNPGLSKTV